MNKVNERCIAVAEEASYIRLADRYTSLARRDFSSHIPDNSRIATFDELLREHKNGTRFRDELRNYCSSKNAHDGWLLVAKGAGYCPENVYWHYKIDNGVAEHVRRPMLHKIPGEIRLTVFMKGSGYLCVKFGADYFPPGNELYMARAVYVMFDRDDEKHAFKSEKR